MLTEREAWLLIAEAFDQYPITHQEVCNTCGLCYTTLRLYWNKLTSIEVHKSMHDKIHSKLEPGQVYLANYNKQGAILRARLAREFAETCLALTNKVD